MNWGSTCSALPPQTSRMSAPAVLLVPPTPLDFDHHQTPSPSSSGTTSSSQPETIFTAVDQQRSSSETTIFSIYSMYGDDHAGSRGSWTAMNGGHRRSKDLPTLPPVNLSLPPGTRESFFSTEGPSSELGLAYLDPPASKPQAVINLTNGVHDFQSGASSSAVRTGLRLPRASFRPATSYNPPTSLEPPPSEMLENARAMAFPVLASAGARLGLGLGEFRTLSPGLTSQSSGPSFRSRSVSPHSPRSSSQTSPYSHKRQSTASTTNRELPPLPSSAHTTPPSTPPPNSIRQATSPFLLSPQGSVRLPNGRLQSNASSPSSKISLAPSEGEDLDSFHVRNTYAVLEVSGVKGDGYEEGVERTRARLGSNRQSQLIAETAVGDGREKTKDLDPKEIELLGSLDRYAYFVRSMSFLC